MATPMTETNGKTNGHTPTTVEAPIKVEAKVEVEAKEGTISQAEKDKRIIESAAHVGASTYAMAKKMQRTMPLTEDQAARNALKAATKAIWEDIRKAK